MFGTLTVKEYKTLIEMLGRARHIWAVAHFHTIGTLGDDYDVTSDMWDEMIGALQWVMSERIM